MSYAVKEIFFTLQGEGVHSGRPAVFCRFSGCNLWTGREEDRHKAVCQFCDTDFFGINGTGGGRFDAVELAQAVAAAWPRNASTRASRFVVCTGGEPLLQVDASLIDALHAQGFEIAVETNGTQLVPEGLDWVCMSPKATTDLLVRSGSELKLVFPQHGAEPHRFEDLDFDHFYLQPMDGPNQAANTQSALQYCLEHPQWKLSIQAHKLLGIR